MIIVVKSLAFGFQALVDVTGVERLHAHGTMSCRERGGRSRILYLFFYAEAIIT
jgi:hypothetical protein